MSNVARLGLEVSAKGVKEATTELARLTTASKAAEKAVKDLSSQKGAASAALAAAKGYQSQSAAALAAAKASTTATNADREAAKAAHAKATAVALAAKADYDSVNASLAAANAEAKQTAALLKTAQAQHLANDNMVKGHNTSNIAAQGFDIVTTAAGGMNAGLIGMQQGLQLAQVAMQSGEGFAKTLGAAFIAMLNPMTFMIVGFTALAALLIQTVNWGWLAAKALDGIAWAVENLTPYLVGVAATLALIYAPALISGLALVATGLFNIGVAALGMAAKITLAWLAAIGPVGWFIAGLAAVVTAAVMFRDELTQIFGFDIVGAAKDGINAIIGAFVGAYKAISATWKMLPSMLGDLMILGANATIAAVEGMVNKIASKLDAFIKKVYGGLRDLASFAGMELGEFGGIGDFDFGRIPNPFAGSALETGQTAIDAAKGSIGPDYLGNMGEAITAGAKSAAEAIRGLADSLTSVEEKGKKAGTETAKAFRGSSFEIENAKKALEGIEATVGFVKDTSRGFVDDFVSGLKNGESAWKSFANAGLNALNKIADKLLDSAFSNFFGSGAGGGWLGALLGGGQWGAAQAGTLLPGLYASGTASARAGMAIVGEEGPELVRFKGGEQVVPNHQMRAANTNRNSGNGSATFNYSSNITVSGNGDKELLARMRKAAQEDVTVALDQYRRNGVQDDIKSYNEDPYKRG